MSDWTIRPATPEDALGIAVVAVAGWQHAYAQILPAGELAEIDVAERADRIGSRWGGKNRTAVAVFDAGLVGFVSQHLDCRLAGFDAEIGGLYVHPGAARCGIGKALLRYAISEWIIPAGMESLAIMTLKDNKIGRAFYESIGGDRVHDDDWTYRERTYPAVWYGFRDLAATMMLCDRR